MHTPSPFLAVIALLILATANPGLAQDHIAAAPLPPEVTVAWDLARAHRESTPTREQICINGLWRWQPAASAPDTVPAEHWGYFKVPGSWPGITDYMQKDSQTVWSHASWRETRLRDLSAAWYQREISVPPDWAGRRITLSAAWVNSLATVWVDGAKVGELRFPGGDLDLTAVCRPGATHLLSLRVAALPLKDVLLSYADTNTAREVKGRVARRGLCGDVFLVGAPAGAHIADVQVRTSFRERKITLAVALTDLAPDARYSIAARIARAGQTVRTFNSQSFGAADLASGRLVFSAEWLPEALWDLHTPENVHEVSCTLATADGRVADVNFARRFGFREFWIVGRDFYLNGSRLQLSVVPFDNAQVSAALAGYAGARESLERLRAIGINFVYTHNYGCEPGSHLAFEEILRAADDVGMLVGFSQPHFSHYDWKAPEADSNNGYARHAAYYVRAAQNHPAVVAYALNHNATGYAGDMDPAQIDGLRDPREPRAQANARLALRTEAIVRQADPSRVIYHHSSGNLGAMHTINFYPNFVPPQELSDWFGHWATTGVKPVFLCEYGAPFSWDWTMYRGWYRGERAFGSAAVPWQFCLAEWNAQFLGDRAFQISAREAANLRWEARQLAAGKVWQRWDYPHQVGASEFEERFPVFALYLADNWPAYRTWGVSAISPWEFGHYWRPREGVDRRRQNLETDWARLQRPGLSADFVEGRYERMDLAFGRDDWVPTEAAQALMRYNQPLLAYLAGKPAAFTSKDHVFTAAETGEKQLIVINNSRVDVTGEAGWTSDLPGVRPGGKSFRLAPGTQERIPISLTIPADTAPGNYTLNATVRFGDGTTQRDAFRLQVLPRPRSARIAGEVALFDPRGATRAQLDRLGVRYHLIDATTDLAPFAVLVVGQAALRVDAPAPDISRVRTGLKVLLFEQTAAVLENRFGFRVAEYGLRRVFPRVPEHPLLAGLDGEHWRDWRGEATLLPPQLDFVLHPRLGPTVEWCGLVVPRLWRAGNRGNVASVLIEKPARGDFLPILDGGYSLQYSPLLEYREGQGLIVFCQLDVSGRTEVDPVAEQVTANLLQHVSHWKPTPPRSALYAGSAAGRAHLAAAGVAPATYQGGPIEPSAVLILGPADAGAAPSITQSVVADFLQAGGRVVALGLDQAELDAQLPLKITVTPREHIATYFEALGAKSALAGIGPADVHNRAPQKLPLVTSGEDPIGNGVLATAERETAIFFQLPPWHFDPKGTANLKRTFRRTTFALTRLLANQGVPCAAPILERFHQPCAAPKSDPRWRSGLYLDEPEEWDDPYRFFRW
jgi:beta-galactosidase